MLDVLYFRDYNLFSSPVEGFQETVVPSVPVHEGATVFMVVVEYTTYDSYANYSTTQYEIFDTYFTLGEAEKIALDFFKADSTFHYPLADRNTSRFGVSTLHGWGTSIESVRVVEAVVQRPLVNKEVNYKGEFDRYVSRV